MKVLITGSNGLLGQKIVGYCISHKISFFASSKGDNRNSKVTKENYANLDITSEIQIQNIISRVAPTVIINTAAITNVDLCESEKELCDEVNVSAVEKLLIACTKHDIHLIHLSTDFVFDGENGPYKEDDERNPLSYYGHSKLKSEDLLLNSLYENLSIVRTIIVFGQGENMSRSNLVLWAKSALESGENLTIVNDQFRAPTFAEDLAWACMKIAEKKKKGIFNISGPNNYSIIELVEKVGKIFNLSTNTLKSISSKTLNQAAERPAKTGFILDKAKKEINYQPKSFEENLEILKQQL